jgi:hypothetical protein
MICVHARTEVSWTAVAPCATDSPLTGYVVRVCCPRVARGLTTPLTNSFAGPVAPHGCGRTRCRCDGRWNGRCARLRSRCLCYRRREIDGRPLRRGAAGDVRRGAQCDRDGPCAFGARGTCSRIRFRFGRNSYPHVCLCVRAPAAQASYEFVVAARNIVGEGPPSEVSLLAGDAARAPA